MNQARPGRLRHKYVRHGARATVMNLGIPMMMSHQSMNLQGERKWSMTVKVFNGHEAHGREQEVGGHKHRGNGTTKHVGLVANASTRPSSNKYRGSFFFFFWWQCLILNLQWHCLNLFFTF